MRGRDTSALAGRSGRTGNTLKVERHQEGLAFGSRDRDAQNMGCATRAAPMNYGVRHLLDYRLLEPIPQRGETPTLLGALSERDLGGARQSNRHRDVLGAWT